MRVLNSFDDSVVIEWDRPCSNNEEIILYNIYVSETSTRQETDLMYQTEAHPANEFASYKIPDLEPDTIYYVWIHAVNALGEGYKAKRPGFMRTMTDSLNQPGSLYVWGNNKNSEVGLTDQLVEENKADYHNFSMTKPVK